MPEVIILDDTDPWWDAIVDTVPHADVYYERAYCRAASLTDGGKPSLFVFDCSAGLVVHPFIRVPLGDSGLSDMISPYGYSGPLSNTPVESLRTASAKAYDIYCKETGAVTTFYRFHPLISTHVTWASSVRTRLLRHTCVIDISSADAVEQNMTSECRNMVRKAQRHGLFFEITDWSLGGPTFLNLYGETMRRLDADSWYHFDNHYFEILATHLSEKPWVCVVRSDGVPCAAALLLRRKPYVHYHLSGWDVRFRQFAPNNYLLYQAAMSAAADGYRFFHLGGGYSGDDALFAFKSEFNRKGILDFYVGEQVHLKDEFASLCASDGGEPANGTFFPPYRVRR